ncbi:MAG: BrnA antitoxin family protein [Treponema sp.]|nr:BrnA antitoxin family protein [Treponema sp.]
MGIVSTVKAGQKPSNAEMTRIRKELGEAKKYPIVFTEDCPESSPEALQEFAHLATERNRLKKKQPVTILVAPDVLEKYKTMGNGYTGIMADVLKYAVNNPDILTEATK